jgi:hypothetical protein
MFGLMITVVFLMAWVLGMLFFRGGDAGPGRSQEGWWPGTWGMGPLGLIVPCFGLVIIMSFFSRMMMGGGGPMSDMTGRGGPMSGMMGRTRGPQSRSQVSRDEPQNTCPSCESLVQAEWKVCPHCGEELPR